MSLKPIQLVDVDEIYSGSCAGRGFRGVVPEQQVMALIACCCDAVHFLFQGKASFVIVLFAINNTALFTLLLCGCLLPWCLLWFMWLFVVDEDELLFERLLFSLTSIYDFCCCYF